MYSKSSRCFFNFLHNFCAKNAKISRFWHFLAQKICQKLNNEQFLLLAKKYSIAMTAKNTNVYFHDGVTNPRVHHIDSVKPYFKIFLAVTDQTDLSCGPFALIPGSHKKKLKNYLMCQFNSKILRKKQKYMENN